MLNFLEDCFLHTARDFQYFEYVQMDLLGPQSSFYDIHSYVGSLILVLYIQPIHRLTNHFWNPQKI